MTNIMAGFIYKLQNIINTSPENDNTDINIARCLLKNVNKIKKKTSLQDIADLCYTSQSSISRFSQRLGYANFNDFKSDCLGIQEELHEMIIDNRAMSIIDFDGYVQTITYSLLKTRNKPIFQQISQLCDYIYEAKRVFIFATHIPGDIACILQRGLLTSGKFVEFYPSKEHQIEVVKQVSSDDLCLFISMEGTLLMEKAITIPAIISLAKNVLITQNVHNKFAEQFTQIIGLGEHDGESLGKYKLLLFIDCVLNCYYHKYVV